LLKLLDDFLTIKSTLGQLFLDVFVQTNIHLQRIDLLCHAIIFSQQVFGLL